jgi:hypothetical protein
MRPIPERLSRAAIITGFDRHSIRSATQKVAYVACSRGREGIEAFVESIADPSQIQNRTGDRKAAVEMALGNSQGDRAEVKELFRQLQRIRAMKAEAAEPKRVADLCRQVAEGLERADLQEHAIRNAQETARGLQEHQARMKAASTRQPPIQQRTQEISYGHER